MAKSRKGMGTSGSSGPLGLWGLQGREYGRFRPSKRAIQERAQDLFYEAMEASSDERAVDLLEQVLQLDPDNVDALLVMSNAEEFDPEEKVAVLREIVAIATRRLGKKAFKDLPPHFWGVLETRPYMRAKEALALALLEAGQQAAAAGEYAEMLRLNENDNQGVRYDLLPLLLELERLDEARDLMERYKNDMTWNVTFAWGLVLERLLSGDPDGAESALVAARVQNPHIEPYLTESRKQPKTTPDSYSPGSKDEALCFVRVLKSAWMRHPAAKAWLMSRTSATKPRSRGAKKPGTAGRGA